MPAQKSPAAALALFALIATSIAPAPAEAQFGGLLKRDLGNVVKDATASDSGCDKGKKKSAGSRVLGGILGRSARSAANRSGLGSFVPVATYADQLGTAIACRLDPDEQKQAAEATLRATRSEQYAGEDGNSEPPPVGSSASWVSGTREEVSGTSTVTARDQSSGGKRDCITVTDVVIIKGEETTAEKRMCRPPGSRRYSIIA